MQWLWRRGRFYQVNFTGTFTSGQVTDVDPSTNAPGTVAALTGTTFSGWLRYDLGIAGPPGVTTDASGFITTNVQGSGPIFVSEHLAINGLTVGSNFLPLPGSFDLAPIGATYVSAWCFRCKSR